MKNRLLITGGTGFFGRALLRHFHQQANSSAQNSPNEYHEVIVISRNPQAFAGNYPDLARAPWLHWVQADISDVQSLDGVLKGQSVKAILHAATDSTDARALSPIAKLDQIVDGTRHILNLAVRLQAQRFLLTSSGGVYGAQPHVMEKIAESYCGMPDPLIVANSYGIGKRMAEHLCTLYQNQYGLECVIARCFAFVGIDLPTNAHFAIGNFIRDALQRTEITVGGDGTAIRTYMDQRDLAHWLDVLLSQGEAGAAYNVGSDCEISIADLAYTVRDVLAPNKKISILGKPDPLAQRNRYVPDIDKARQTFGLNLKWSLTQSLEMFR